MIAKAKHKRKRKPSHRWTLADWWAERPELIPGRCLSVPPEGPYYYRDYDQHGRPYCSHTFDLHRTERAPSKANPRAREPITREEYEAWLIAECGWRPGPFQWPEGVEPTEHAPPVHAEPESPAYRLRYARTCRMLESAGLEPKPYDEWLAQVQAAEARQ